MAKLNVDLPDRDLTNYSAFSRGFTEHSKTANLVGLGTSLLEGGIKIADETIKNVLSSQVTEETEKIRDSYGPGSSSVINSTNTRTPLEVQKAGEELDALHTAYRTGKLKDSHYYARLDVVVRNFKSRYPGYKDLVDNKVQEITGVNPANALLSSLRSEARAGADDEDSPTKRMMKLEERASFDGNLPEDYFLRRQQGKPYQVDELLNAISIRQRQKANLDLAKSEMSFAKERNEEIGSKAQNIALKAIGNEVDNTLRSINSVNGTSYEAYMEGLRTNIKNGRKLSSQEQTQLRAVTGQLDEQIKKTVFNRLYTADSQGVILADHMTPNEIKEVEDRSLARFKHVTDAYANADYGLMGANASALQVQSVSDRETFLGSENIRKVKALNDLGVPQVTIDRFLLEDVELSTALQRDIKNVNLIDLISNNPEGAKSLSKTFEKLEQDPDLKNTNKATLYRALTKKLVAFAADPESVGSAGFDDALQTIYGQGNQNLLSLFNSEDATKVWRDATDINLINKVMADGTEEQKSMTIRWLESNAMTLNKYAFDVAQNIITNRAGLELTYDFKNPLLILTPKQRRAEGLTPFVEATSNEIEKQYFKSANKAIEQINSSLFPLKSAYKKLGYTQDQINDRIASMMQGAGMNFNAERGKPEQETLFTNIGLAMKRAAKGLDTLGNPVGSGILSSIADQVVVPK